MKTGTRYFLGFALLALALQGLAAPGDPVYTIRMLDGTIWRLNHLSVNGDQRFNMKVGNSHVDAGLSTMHRVQFTGKPEQRDRGPSGGLWRPATVTYKNTSSQKVVILTKGSLGTVSLRGTDTKTSSAVRVPLENVKSIEFPRER